MSLVQGGLFHYHFDMFYRLRSFVLPFILLVVLGFGTWHLTESPAIWGDEGLLIELSVNLARHGKMMSQIAPNQFVSGAFMTTGFPVIYPVAASFAVFGFGILQARSVMVIFMLLAVAAVFVYAKRLFGTRNAAFAALLIATFPPFYGNGKNVLGEIPGLFFMVLFLLTVHHLETSEKKRRLFFLLSGITAGLCLATKPIFLTLLPAIVGGVILARKKIERDIRAWMLFAFGLALPILFWLKTQFFPGDSVHDILSMYANPYQLDNINAVIVTNFLRFFRESAPIYLLLIFAIWSFSFLPRLWKDLRSKPRQYLIPLSEAISYAFCGLILVAYLRTPGWYRYFFPTQIIAFIYFPASLRFCWNKIYSFGRSRGYAPTGYFLIRLLSHVPCVIIAGLIFLQAYQASFNSWVATTYRSTMTRELTEYFKTFDPTKSIFVVPEIIVFLPNDNYYHFINVVGFTFGDEEALGAVMKGIPDFLITSKYIWDTPDRPYTLYQEKTRIGRYVIAERQK
jgi:4-amino-4-deoxy-L-arabinose transferase-like glycosyltransferase